MKQQGNIYFKNLDLNKFKYPVVLICDGDFFSDHVVGPFENKEHLKVYIEKKNLTMSLDNYIVTEMTKPVI